MLALVPLGAPASRCIGARKPRTGAFRSFPPHGRTPRHGRPFVPLEQGLNVSAPHEPFQCEPAGPSAADCGHDRRGELRRPFEELSQARTPSSGAAFAGGQASRRTSETRAQPCPAPVAAACTPFVPARAGFPRRMPHRCCHDSCYLELGCKAPHAPELLLKHLCGGCCLCANTRPLVCPCSLFCMHVSVPMADESNPPTLCTSRARLGAVALCYGAGSTCDSPFSTSLMHLGRSGHHGAGRLCHLLLPPSPVLISQDGAFPRAWPTFRHTLMYQAHEHTRSLMRLRC